MKCIDCGSNARRRDLRAGRCRACGRAFAFDSASDPHPVADAQFAAAVASVSANGRVFFTARQLWHELHREVARPPSMFPFRVLFPLAGGAGATALGALGAFGALGVSGVDVQLVGVGMAAGLVAGGLVISAGTSRERRLLRGPPTIPLDLFRSRYLERWTAVHGPLPRLVPDPEPDAAPHQAPADAAALAFDRVVVTQHADTAAMLAANRFHFAGGGCAVLSLDGYPFGAAETARETLRRNPRLTVFALHDASAEGAALPLALRGPAWFPDPATRIVDVGLRAARGGGSLPVPSAPPAALPERAPNERPPAADPAWREAGNGRELAELRPVDLRWILQRAFTAAGHAGHTEAARGAMGAGGIVRVGDLPFPPGDTAPTDGSR